MAKRKKKPEIVVLSETGVSVVTQDFLTGETSTQPLPQQRHKTSTLTEPLPQPAYGYLSGDGSFEVLQAKLLGEINGATADPLTRSELERCTGNHQHLDLLLRVLERRGLLPEDVAAVTIPALLEGQEASWRVAVALSFLERRCEPPRPFCGAVPAAATEAHQRYVAARQRFVDALEKEFPMTRPTTPLAYWAAMCASDHENDVLAAHAGVLQGEELTQAGRRAKAEARATQERLLRAALAL